MVNIEIIGKCKNEIELINHVKIQCKGIVICTDGILGDYSYVCTRCGKREDIADQDECSFVEIFKQTVCFRTEYGYNKRKMDVHVVD